MDSVKVIERQKVTAKSLKVAADNFVAALQQRNIAREVPTFIPLRINPAKKSYLLSRFRQFDSVNLHILSDKVHKHRLEPFPGGESDVRAHDIAVLLSNGFTEVTLEAQSKIGKFLDFVRGSSSVAALPQGE